MSAVMGFWDDPANWPSNSAWPTRPGETVEGTVTRMELGKSRYDRAQLVIELDRDGIKRWCNSRLWRCLGDARVEVGDRIRVIRGHDDPNSGGQRPASTWTVERLPHAPPAPAPPAQQWAAQATPTPPTGPSW